MKKKPIISILAICLTFFSCSKDEEKTYTHPNLGDYALVRLTSNVAMDLNFDNIKTKDFIIEMEEYFRNPNRSNGGQLKLVTFNNPKELSLLLDLPSDNYRPEIFFRFGPGDYSKMLEINPSSNEIEKIRHVFFQQSDASEDWIIANRYPFPSEVKFADQDNISIKIRQLVFNNETGVREVVLLEGTWRRK